MKTTKRRMPVEISEELHRRAKVAAIRRGVRLYELVEEAVLEALNRKPKPQTQEAA